MGKLIATTLLSWWEPRRVTRRRMDQEMGKGTRFRFRWALIVILLTLVPWVGGPPDSSLPVEGQIVLSVLKGILLFFLFDFVKWLPHTVKVTDQGIQGGAGIFRYSEIERGVVELQQISGRWFPILTLSFKSGQDRVMGVAHQVSLAELRDLLRRHGVAVSDETPVRDF